jgi:hypothetical protein
MILRVPGEFAAELIEQRPVSIIGNAMPPRDPDEDDDGDDDEDEHDGEPPVVREPDED